MKVVIFVFISVLKSPKFDCTKPDYVAQHQK